MRHYRLPLMSKLTEYFPKKRIINFEDICPNGRCYSATESNGVKNTHLLSRGVDTELFHPSKRDHALEPLGA